MDTLPEVVSVQKQGHVLNLKIQVKPDLFQFRGHFPGQPILPGVAQVDWVVRMFEKHFDYGSGYTKLGQLKFAKLIEAGAMLNLKLTLISDKRRVLFEFSDGPELYSSGYLELPET